MGIPSQNEEIEREVVVGSAWVAGEVVNDDYVNKTWACNLTHVTRDSEIRNQSGAFVTSVTHSCYGNSHSLLGRQRTHYFAGCFKY
jgi:hypothetical protein